MSKQKSSWNGKAKPFLKWAGGKRQLIDEIEMRLPHKIKSTKKINRYVEPFLGGGAVFFYLQNNYEIDKSFIFDINRELIVCYKVVKNNISKLIDILQEIEKEYLKLTNEKREKKFYDIRTKYNNQIENFDYNNFNKDWSERAANLIFLNRTCFNGLFRQNKKGEFNVPFGRYKNPTICNKDNLFKVSNVLKNAKIEGGDFSKSKKYINDKTFVYFDPPYRPINATSSFTGYSKGDFDDEDQIRLAKFFKAMDKKGSYLMLSNSDPKNHDKNDSFFEELYSDFVINRVAARRSINSKKDKRGIINELIIRNYNV